MPGIKPVSIEQLQEQEKVLMGEAANILNQEVFKLPPGTEHPASRRLVECIVSISMMNISQMMIAIQMEAPKPDGAPQQS